MSTKTTGSYKLVILGDVGVGKTSLISQFFFGSFNESHEPTIEDSFRTKFTHGSEISVVEVLDVAGDDQINWLKTQSDPVQDGFIIVYDVTSRESFSKTRELIDQLFADKWRETRNTLNSNIPDDIEPFYPHTCPILLVGNKCDKRKDRVVSVKEGQNLAKIFGSAFVETSAKSKTNVNNAFYNLLSLIKVQRSSIPRCQKCTGLNFPFRWWKRSSHLAISLIANPMSQV